MSEIAKVERPAPRLYTRRDLAKLATVGLIGCSLEGPASAHSRAMLGVRGAMMAQSKDTGMTKGLFISQNGAALMVASPAGYVPVAGSSSISAILNSKGCVLYIVEYDENYSVNDYWQISSTRTFTLKASTAYIRFTVEDGYDGAFVLNNSTGEYIYQNGRLVDSTATA